MSERWLEVTLPVSAQDMDRVCDTLTNNGMTGLVVKMENSSSFWSKTANTGTM